MVGTLSLALASRSSIANPMSKNSRTSLSDGSVCAIVATVYYAQLNSLKLRWWWWYTLLVMNGTNDVDRNYNVKSWGSKKDECEDSISSCLSLSSWFMRLTRFKEQTELGRRGKQGFIILTRLPPLHVVLYKYIQMRFHILQEVRLWIVDGINFFYDRLRFETRGK